MTSYFESDKQAVLHILVVGFHHKKGCQVEFSFPPLVEGENENSTDLPEEWKYLPFLALPDGAHNYNEDIIYFHLPPRPHFLSQSTVYGVSCYQQIAAHLLKRKDDDVTRGTVQKCVVALSQLPIYAVLHSKLKMITQAYFEEKDFAKNDILKELFVHMNISIRAVEDSKKHHELSPRMLVTCFQHKVLVLFKLILLERKVLFYTSPVKKLASGLMSLLSLFPDMIEKGLSECTLPYQRYLDMLKSSNNLREASLNHERSTDKTKQEDTTTPSVQKKTDATSNQENADGLSVSDVKFEGSWSWQSEKEPALPLILPSAQKNDFAISNNPENADSLSVSDVNFDRSWSQQSEKQTVLKDTGNMVKNTPPIETNTLSNFLNCSPSVIQEDALPQPKEQTLKINEDPGTSNGLVLSTLDNEIVILPRQSTSSLWEATSEAALNLAASVSSKLEDLSLSLTSTLYNDSANDPNFNVFNEIEEDEEVDRLNIGFQNSRLEIKSESPVMKNIQLPKSLSPLPSNVVEINSQNDISIDLKPHFPTDNNGFPLSIFSRGYFCHPYVALQQMPDLTNNMERGYVIGATNVLFKTQPHLADVVVDIGNSLLEIRNVDLKRQLHLSAADLRFAENLVNTVARGNAHDSQWDATCWEGGDEWVQAQFFDYLTSLLATSLASEISSKEINDFNEHFLDAWKRTKNYQIWRENSHAGVDHIRPEHPCQAQYSVNDMRLRLHHNLQSTDRGRKLEGAMSSANQAVLNTKKFMGSALVTAKSNVTSWLSNKIRKET